MATKKITTKTAAKTAAKKAAKPRRSWVERQRVALVREHKRLDRLAARFERLQPQAPGSVNAAQALRDAEAAAADALEQLGRFPLDFRPSRSRRAHVAVGAHVIVRESKRPLYEGLFDDFDQPVEVAALVGTRRVLVVGEDGQRAVFPVAHVKVA